MEAPHLSIYNVPTQPPRWDAIGIFYVSLAAVWTSILLAGMAFCWVHRNLPILRIRGLPLAFGSITSLHLYWIMAQIVYPIGMTMPVVVAYDVQYFVMGMWFPLGIALFHASNWRFLQVAGRQKRFANADPKASPAMSIAKHPKSSWMRMLGLSRSGSRIMMFITIGVVLQCLLCLSMWLACKKYHPSFGVPGTEISGQTLPAQLIDLGRGWEWWPSVLWQFIWTWGVAPYMIWKAMPIRDTMGWRTQTIGACLSGLPATPMFLIASYTPAFYRINAYFPPSQWIHFNTFCIESFTVFVPAYQVLRLWRLSKRAVIDNPQRAAEAQSIVFRIDFSHGGTGSIKEVGEASRLSDDDFPNHLLSMRALSSALVERTESLQRFSAYHDFSGENIAFLTSLSRWRATCMSEDRGGTDGATSFVNRTSLFNAALKIYVDFVSPIHAEFPLNLSSNHLEQLGSTFGEAARIRYGESHTESWSPFSFNAPSTKESHELYASITNLRAQYAGDIPQAFSSNVFDEVEKHVKRLVLTNTWPKYVEHVLCTPRRPLGRSDSSSTQVSKGSFVTHALDIQRGRTKS